MFNFCFRNGLLVLITFVCARHPVHVCGAARVFPDQIREHPDWPMWPVVHFEYFPVTRRGPIGYQHQGLVALAALSSAIVLQWAI